MAQDLFKTLDGFSVPAVTSEEMKEVDHIAADEYELEIKQMMENAGRNLTQTVFDLDISLDGMTVTVLAGSGGNGGGGICCARHLHNRGVDVSVVLDRKPEDLKGDASDQYRILNEAGFESTPPEDARDEIEGSVVIDSLIGYGLEGEPRGTASELIELCEYADCVVSLDIPSGVNATIGNTPGVAVESNRVVTLALPKTGLEAVDAEIYLGDIGIPPKVFDDVGVSYPYEKLFERGYLVKLLKTD